MNNKEVLKKTLLFVIILALMVCFTLIKKGADLLDNDETSVSSESTTEKVSEKHDVISGVTKDILYGTEAEEPDHMGALFTPPNEKETELLTPTPPYYDDTENVNESIKEEMETETKVLEERERKSQ